MEIIDNFIFDDDLKKINEIMFTNRFPWYYSDTVMGREHDRYFYFIHNFLKDGQITSKNGWLIEPIIRKIDPKHLVRVRANLYPRELKQIQHGMHVDVILEEPCTTGIFYFNDCNGYTLFEDGTKVESKANRFVKFDCRTKHSSVGHTDAKCRYVLNVNYYE